MRVISDYSEQEIATRCAEEEVLRCLKNLTGELMRIVRGAGKPSMVERLAGEFMDAASDYRQIAGHGLSTDRISAALSVWQEPESDHPVAYIGKLSTEESISGALQIAASRLLFDPIRERKGAREIFEAMTRWMDSREAARKADAQERRKDIAAVKSKRHKAASGGQKGK